VTFLPESSRRRR